jgi:MFS family permease
MFTLGLALFTVTSTVCGLAPNVEVLVAGRLLQGAAAALLMPQTLAVINTSFFGEARSRAFAAYGLTMGVGAVLGQVIGGLLIEADIAGSGWRAIFLVNLPFGAAALAAVPRTVPESRAEHPARLDLTGVAMLSAALVALVLPLVLGREQGWPEWTVLSLVASPLLLAAWAAYERRLALLGGAPLLDVTALRDRGFAGGLGVALVFCLGQASFFLVLSLYLQQTRGLGPLGSGGVVAIVGAGFFAALLTGQPIAHRYGRQALAAGALLVAGGYQLLALETTSVHVPLWHLAPGLVVAGFGMGLVLSPLAETVLARVHPAHAAAASGALSTALDVGGAIGVAVIGAVYLSRTGAGASGVHAFRLALEVASGAGLLAAALVQVLPRRVEVVDPMPELAMAAS